MPLLVLGSLHPIGLGMSFIIYNIKMLLTLGYVLAGVVVVVVKTLFKSHTLTSSTISWFPRGACELHRKIDNLNTTYIYTGQIAHLRCAMLRKQAYVSIKSMQKFLKPNRKVDCANVSDLEGI